MKKFIISITLLIVPILIGMVACNNEVKVVELDNGSARAQNETRSQGDSLKHLRMNDSD